MSKNKHLIIAYLIGCFVFTGTALIPGSVKYENAQYCYGDDKTPRPFSEAARLKPGECMPAIKRTTGWPITSRIRWYTMDGKFLTRERRVNPGLQVLNVIPPGIAGLVAGFATYRITKRLMNP